MKDLIQKLTDLQEEALSRKILTEEGSTPAKPETLKDVFESIAGMKPIPVVGKEGSSQETGAGFINVTDPALQNLGRTIGDLAAQKKLQIVVPTATQTMGTVKPTATPGGQGQAMGAGKTMAEQEGQPSELSSDLLGIAENSAPPGSQEHMLELINKYHDLKEAEYKAYMERGTRTDSETGEYTPGGYDWYKDRGRKFTRQMEAIEKEFKQHFPDEYQEYEYFEDLVDDKLGLRESSIQEAKIKPGSQEHMLKLLNKYADLRDAEHNAYLDRGTVEYTRTPAGRKSRKYDWSSDKGDKFSRQMNAIKNEFKTYFPDEYQEYEYFSDLVDDKLGLYENMNESKLNEKFASQQQAKLMYAAAGDKDVSKKTGVSQKVAKEFIKKSHGQKVSKLPKKVDEAHTGDEAENIAWATANKRGMLDNKNKKVTEGSGPKEKQKRPYVDYFSPENRAKAKAAADAEKAKFDQDKKAKAAEKIGKKKVNEAHTGDEAEKKFDKYNAKELDYMLDRAYGRSKPGDAHKQKRAGQAKNAAYNIMWRKKYGDLAEGDIPSSSGVDTRGAGLGAGRSMTTLEDEHIGEGKDEGKPGKNFAKIAKSAGERYGSKAAGERVAGAVRAKLAKQGKLEEAKPDFIDLDKDGDKKESMKKAMADKKKKKVNETMNNRIRAARHEGHSHGLRGHSHCGQNYDDMEEAKAYHEGYKEGLDECYGMGVYEGGMDEGIMDEGMSGMTPAMKEKIRIAREILRPYNLYREDKIYTNKLKNGYSVKANVRKERADDVGLIQAEINQRIPGAKVKFNRYDAPIGTRYAGYPAYSIIINIPFSQVDEGGMDEGNAFTGALARTPRGGKFSVGGRSFTDNSSLEEYAFESRGEIDEHFYFDAPAKKPNRTGEDELARREKLGKNILGKKSPHAAEYKTKDKYGDMYKIAGPKGNLPEQAFESRKQLDELSPQLLNRAADKAYDKGLDLDDGDSFREKKIHPAAKEYWRQEEKFRKGARDAEYRDRKPSFDADIAKLSPAKQRRIAKQEQAFESWNKQLKTLINEGVSVSISKGLENGHDSATVTATDGDTEKLMALVKQAGLGVFGDDEQASNYGAPTDAMMHGGIEVVGDHDGMMGIMKKLAGVEMSGSSDYADEANSDATCSSCGCEDCECDDSGEEASCDGCGMQESKCQCDEEQVDEVETEDQMTAKVAEDESGQEEMGATEAEEDNALAKADAAEDEEDELEESFTFEAINKKLAMLSKKSNEKEDKKAEIEYDDKKGKKKKVDEWANGIGGKGKDAEGKGTDASFERDIEFMTKTIAGGLNKPKSTGQTTIPVVAGQANRTEQPTDWAILAGIK